MDIKAIKTVIGIVLYLLAVGWTFGFVKAADDRNVVDMVRCGFGAVIMMLSALCL